MFDVLKWISHLTLFHPVEYHFARYIVTHNEIKKSRPDAEHKKSGTEKKVEREKSPLLHQPSINADLFCFSFAIMICESFDLDIFINY